jgi:hypothetical protein
MYPSDARWFIPGKQPRRDAMMGKADTGKGKVLRGRHIDRSRGYRDGGELGILHDLGWKEHEIIQI